MNELKNAKNKWLCALTYCHPDSRFFTHYILIFKKLGSYAPNNKDFDKYYWDRYENNSSEFLSNTNLYFFINVLDTEIMLHESYMLHDLATAYNNLADKFVIHEYVNKQDNKK